MIFEIRKEGKTIGVSELEFGDPHMGIVHGDLIPTQFFFPNADTTDCKLFISETDEEIICGFIAIEDLSQELDEPAITVTILVSAAEDYEKFLKHHLDRYEKNSPDKCSNMCFLQIFIIYFIDDTLRSGRFCLLVC